MPTVVRVLFVVVAALHTAAPAQRVEYEPPVDAPVVDPFRAPATRYGAGNRGVDYATTPGEVVRAAAGGTVVFAGRVGNGLHVVVRHEDGVRTTYAFVQSIEVKRDQRVERGETVATAGTRLHFGARIGDVYVDPAQLFGTNGRGTHAYLVDDDNTAESSAEERRHLVDLVRGVVPPPSPAEVDQWEHDNAGCTPAEVQPPSAASNGRRIAVLVGGLGSATGDAAILGVDTATLGYAASDVHQFSYRADGGAYGPRDTQQDINVSAQRLRDEIARLHEANPGVPIDVFAHSQGGLVTRAAMSPTPEALAGVATVVTLATPHRGNSLAAAGDVIAATTGAAARVMAGVAAIAGEIDPSSPSVRQLAKNSSFLRALEQRPLPDGVNVTAIAASTDPVVPAADARWAAPEVANTVVQLTSAHLDDHARLPGDPAATREIALAVAGKRPTCVALDEWQRRRLGSITASRAQTAAATTAKAAARWLDERVPAGGRTMTRR